MQYELLVLIASAISVAFLHTLSGPDHYLPFVALSRSRGWSEAKTIRWTVLCGCGHIASSVLLGLLGAALGWTFSSITFLQQVRGGAAGWVMLFFGLAYAGWGIYRAERKPSHKHFDLSDEGEMYVFEHDHAASQLPVERHKVTPWVMFIIFLLGPCEPLIPLLYFPAAQNSWGGMLMLIAVYSAVTIITMVALVMLGKKGISLVATASIERHMHSLAGLTIFICGAAMVFLGW